MQELCGPDRFPARSRREEERENGGSTFTAEQCDGQPYSE